MRRMEELAGVPVDVVGGGPRPRAAALHRDVSPVKVLVVGGGGREHALGWGLARSPHRRRAARGPGNAGHGAVADVLPTWRPTTSPRLVKLVDQRAVDLVVVGPEAPLVAGLADALARRGVAVFGPVPAAARLEGSKAFAEGRHGAARRPHRTCGTRSPTRRRGSRSSTSSGGRAVVKADGLAAGKGVTVADDRDGRERGDRGLPRRRRLRRRPADGRDRGAARRAGGQVFAL